MSKSCTKNILYTTANTFCCPKLEIVMQETCQEFQGIVGDGQPITVFNPSLYQSISLTLFVDPSTTGNITLDGNSIIHSIPDITVQPGSNATMYVPKARLVTLSIPNGEIFTGKLCTKIYYRQVSDNCTD
ncbi:S-Ena type endospore appendage [Bacillus mycoides]|uniref:S-Ena type endospore appendage n=1 Tax=Bacillus mycoides TaxID=1405 RepID=UPI003D660EB2